MELTIKPEFHDLIPPISSEEYQLLEESLLNEGCREVLVTWNDCILDGHNRYEICQKHNIGFKVFEKEFDSEDEAKVWIIRNQLARRNLPTYERGRLLLALKPLIMEKAREKQRGGQGGVLLPQISAKAKIETREELAKAAGVSHDTISKIETIEKKASPEVKEAARKGEISVNKAYASVRPKSKIKTLRHDSDNLQRLKLAWRHSSASDRRKFLIWIKRENKNERENN